MACRITTIVLQALFAGRNGLVRPNEPVALDLYTSISWTDEVLRAQAAERSAMIEKAFTRIRNTSVIIFSEQFWESHIPIIISIVSARLVRLAFFP